MRKTYHQLEKELFHKTRSEENLKRRIRSLRDQMRVFRFAEKQLVLQYERLVRDWRIRYESMMKNGWKIVLAKIVLWYTNLKEGKKI